MDRGREQEGVVGDGGRRPTKVAECERADIVAVDAHTARVDVVEAGDEPGDRGLAASSGADDGDGLSRFDRGGEPAKHGFALTHGVAEVDVVELDAAGRVGKGDGVVGLDDRRGLVEDVEHPDRRRAGALPLDEDEAQQSEWRGEQDDIGGEGDEVADGEFTVDGLQAAVEQHECEAETRQ